MSNYLEGQIAAILDDKTVVVNRGLSHGVSEGDKFYIYSEIGPFKDPESEEELGVHKEILGSVVVDTVEEKFCIASTPTRVTFSGLAGLSANILAHEKREKPSLPINESQKHESSKSFKVEVGTPVFRPESDDQSEANDEEGQESEKEDTGSD